MIRKKYAKGGFPVFVDQLSVVFQLRETVAEIQAFLISAWSLHRAQFSWHTVASDFFCQGKPPFSVWIILGAEYTAGSRQQGVGQFWPN